MRRARDAELGLVPQMHAGLVADLDRRGQAGKISSPRLMTASSAAQDRSDASK